MQAKRRLVYLTTINLSSNKAQSLQVKQVVNSLNNVCKEKNISFKAFSFFEVNEPFQELFKVFGNLIITFLFIIGQMPLLAKYIEEPEKNKDIEKEST